MHFYCQFYKNLAYNGNVANYAIKIKMNSANFNTKPKKKGFKLKFMRVLLILVRKLENVV